MARVLVFGLIVTTVIVLTHIYLYRRMVQDLTRRPTLRRLGKFVFVLIPVLMILGVVGARTLPPPWDLWAGYLAYIWMGLVILSVPILWGVDALRGLLRLKRGAPMDPERRIMMARGAAALTTLGAVGAGAVAVKTALELPELRHIDVPIKDLPDPLVGFQICQLSDIHVGPTIRRSFIESLVERVNALGVDLVAITGDLVDGSVDHLSPDVEPLQDLKSRHGTFFCTGNHEYYSGVDSWLAKITQMGIRTLRNERVVINHDGAELDVLGVDDWRAKGFGGDHGFDMDKAAAGRDRSRPSVLLCHQPKGIDAAAKHDLDLVLSGHTHGGQLWPAVWLVKLVQPYVSGFHQHTERTSIYVHTGTGYWGPPMRLPVKAEIAVLTLRKRSA